MNTEKLSERLNTVACYVPNGSKLADIGSDHAYLPCYLVKKGSAPFAIAGEVAAGPYESARRQVLSESLTEVISVRKGDGLDVLKPGEADCITIAGMGGTLITSILERGKEKLGSVKRLVLQPNISSVTVRKWLLENQWELIAEEILEEDGKIYEILVAENGDAEKPYGDDREKELLLGPFLLKKRTAVFRKKWKMELENWQKIYKQLEMASQSEETNRKRKEIHQLMNHVEEVFTQ